MIEILIVCMGGIGALIVLATLILLFMYDRIESHADKLIKTEKDPLYRWNLRKFLNEPLF